jgi:hypothetical protein
MGGYGQGQGPDGIEGLEDRYTGARTAISQTNAETEIVIVLIILRLPCVPCPSAPHLSYGEG